jgi:hypothetical protein
MFDKMMSEEWYLEDFMTSMFSIIYEKLKNKKDNENEDLD